MKLRLLSAAALVALLACTALPTASAQAPAIVPIDLGPNQSAWSLARMGYEAGVAMTGSRMRQDLMLPLTPGQHPEALVLHLTPSPMMPEGYLRITSGGRVLAQHVLPNGPATLQLPLRGARAEAGGLPLTIDVQLRGTDRCDAETFYRVQIAPESALVFSGQPAPPRTISAFFPLRLETMTVYLPEAPSEAAIQSVLWLSTYLPRRYPTATPTLTLQPHPGDLAAIPTPQPGERVLVWEEEALAALAPLPAASPNRAARGTVLVLGRTQEAQQLFQHPDGDRLAVAGALETNTSFFDAFTNAAPDVTLDYLGYNAQTVQGSDIVPAYYNFSLSALQPGTYPVGVHLKAQHTEVTPRDQGYIYLYLNGILLQSATLSGSEAELRARVPHHALRRDNTLEAQFHFAAPSHSDGPCTQQSLPFTATIDPRSALEVEAGTVLPPGFDRFPQALVPAFDVAIDAPTRTRLARVSRLLMALQTSARPMLQPTYRATSPAASAADAPALLAYGDAAFAGRLGAPVGGPGFFFSAGDPALKDLTFTPGDPFVALQAYAQHERDILLLSYAPEAEDRVDALLTEVMAPHGWFSVHGDLAVRGLEGEAVTLRYLADAPSLQAIAEPSLARFFGFRWMWVGVVLLIAAALAAGARHLRDRRAAAA